MAGFIFPNEGIIEWDLLIVIYPFITGLVAGAFIVSSLYHVFGIASLRPVARFSLLTALAFLIVTPMPLVMHLGKPFRGLEMFLTPNLNSAMSAFGYIWFIYLLIVLMEIWLVFRPDIIRYATTSDGALKTIYSALALGVYETSPESLAIDRKLIKILAFIGIPAALLLHGYVGFIFGAVKANPWWSTPLMPIIFIMSATVSGIALLVLLYVLTSKIRGVPIDHTCLCSLSLWLTGFLAVNVVLEGLEVFSMLYEAEESWEIVSRLITEVLGISYFGIQFTFGAIIPLLVLGGTEIIRLRDQEKTILRSLAASMVLIGVFAMRWNVVIGGQLMSKSFRGFTSYVPPVWGINGLVVSAIIMLLPFILLAVLIYLIPPWLEQAQPRRESAIRRSTFSTS